MNGNFNILVNKLNRFRFKYYTFRVVKGLILTFLILLALFTIFSVAEYFIYLPSDLRKVLFFGFLFFGLLLTVHFILVPLLKLLRIVKPIDSRSSSAIIQKHFKDIKDKLLNVIELSELHDSSVSRELILASIDQKISQLNVFDFRQAVQFKNLKLIMLYFTASLLVTVVVFAFNRAIFETAPKRIIQYNTHFAKPAPYTFHLLNDHLNATKGEAFTIRMETSGNEIPQVAYVNIEGNNYLMKNKGSGVFEYEMASVINPVNFYFTDLKHLSETFSLNLLPKPGISRFDVVVTPPAYTRLSEQHFENIGDLQVPTGTQVEWNFSGVDIDTLYLSLADSFFTGAVKEDNAFYAEHRFYESSDYRVFIKNNLTEPHLALSYSVDVIPDLYPDIQITGVQDSTKMTRFFFKGSIGDDYGFTALHFHYNINNTDSSVSIPFVNNLNDQDFYYSFDFAELDVPAGSVSYYFSVTDNDAINNYKTTTSDNYVFNLPTQREIDENEKEQFERLEKMVGESEKLAHEIQTDLQNLRLKNMDSNVSEWEKKQMVNEVLAKQNQLEELYEKIKKDNEQLNNFMNSFSEQNERIVEKQKQIEELLEEVFTDELKSLLEEFQKLAEQFDSRKLNELTEKMNYTYEDLQKQLDRNLEMLRRMKVEQKIQNVIDNMKRMAEEEERMAQDLNSRQGIEKSREAVEKHSQEFEDIRDQMENALKMNEELERKLNFDDFSEDLDDIDNSLENTREALDKENQRKAEEGMKESSEKMKEAAMAMQEMLDSNMEKQNLENIQNLKQILSNLVFLSFEQEKVLTDLSEINTVDPVLNELNRVQKRIQDQSRIVKDSLYALAKRTPQINNMVNNELLNLEHNLNKAIDEMGEGLYPNARASQQYVMTATNNLALLLNEALENLEVQMANARPGDQNGENQGQGKQGLNLLQEQSESIKEQLQKMIDQMKQGNQGNMNQQLGQMLMQHEMMQQMLREMMNNSGMGNDAKKALQEIDNALEQNRKELMNKNINSEMIARQNLISTRLLEAEKAEMEREYDDERESKTAEDFYSNPVEFFEYDNNNNPALEHLNRDSHRLSNFYNKKYKQYLNNIQNN